MPDDDGYPTEYELQQILNWPETDPIGWFACIKASWWLAEWAWHESDGVDDLKRPHRFYHISTGGWSENEALIRTMRECLILWMQTWKENWHGGHYIFSTPLPKFNNS